MKIDRLLFLIVFLIIGEAQAQSQLKLVKAVRQKGPVAYRDPFGSISPDGLMFAYSDLRNILIQPIFGGASYEFLKNGAFIRYLTWLPDSRSIVTYELGGKSQTWYRYEVANPQGQPLWGSIDEWEIEFPDIGIQKISRGDLRELAWSKGGDQVAGKVRMNARTYVIVFDPEGQKPEILTSQENVESICWNPVREGWAGIVTVGGERYIDLNLDVENNILIKANSFGRIAFSGDGETLFYTLGNEKGILDLWKHDLRTNEKEKLAAFDRDSYDPSVSDDGTVLFKLQDYRIHIATINGDGTELQTITRFQSEIPYWHPDGNKISFTYGTWRRVMNDAQYPDIDQSLGAVSAQRTVPATEPEEIIRASYSEDQGMSWSPNLKWVVFHTHADGTDDIWLQPSGDPSKGKPLSTGGHETGWPRWSPDGRWIVYNTALSSDRINKLFLIGIDQNKGKITVPQKQLNPPGLELGSFTDAQWMSDSKALVIEYVVDENNKEIHQIPIDGSQGKLIHKFESDQLYSGIGLSNDDQWVAYIAPDEQGIFQVHKVSIDGQKVQQVTTDPTDKAHPVYSPTEDRIAFSVFNYQAIFWMIAP